MKHCGKCNGTKPLTEFTKTKTGKYQSFCKDCNKEYQRNHYRLNKKSYLEKQKKRRQEWMIWWREIKGDLKCSSCDEDHIACLDFHHTGEEEKEMHLSTAVHNTWSKKKILEEMAKCIVICSNCHRKLHWEMAVSSNG